MKPPCPRVDPVAPTPGLGQPIIVNGIPGLILDLWARGEGHWVARTNRGLVCRIERPLRQMGDSLAWLGRPCPRGDVAPNTATPSDAGSREHVVTPCYRAVTPGGADS